ncbi:MAG TPA: divalent-cation tolerance protein CutA [Thermoplasmata archaeon]|nr:divalent-cation tolerance protein CutA [Thermoplasmata archaeon]
MSPDPLDPARAFGSMRLVLTTYPSSKAARRAIESVLERRLAACANVLAIDSRYRWKSRIESARESLVLFKTVPKRVGALLTFLEVSHPYETPEVVEIDIPRANAGYLRYLESTLESAIPFGAGRSGATRRAVPRGRGARGPGRTRAPRRHRSR